MTQRRHDHANAALFPIANLAINAYSFTSFEGIFRHRLMPYLSVPFELTAERIAQLPLHQHRDMRPTAIAVINLSCTTDKWQWGRCR